MLRQLKNSTSFGGVAEMFGYFENCEFNLFRNLEVFEKLKNLKNISSFNSKLYNFQNFHNF